MITKQNFKQLLTKFGFIQKQDKFIKQIHGHELKVDFKNKN